MSIKPLLFARWGIFSYFNPYSFMCCQLLLKYEGASHPNSVLLSQPWVGHPVSRSRAPPPWRPQAPRIPGIREKPQELLGGWSGWRERIRLITPSPRGSTEENPDFSVLPWGPEHANDEGQASRQQWNVLTLLLTTDAGEPTNEQTWNRENLIWPCKN